METVIESRDPGPKISDKPEIVKQIQVRPDKDELRRTLSGLVEKALATGAADATAVEAEAVRFSSDVLERVNTDDKYPSAHWPAHYPNDDIRDALNAYQAGILFRVQAPAEMPDYGGGPISDPAHRQAVLKTYEIATLLESGAFYLGCHLAMAFAAGNCRAVFCYDEKRCWASIKGRCCIHPYRARPSLAAIGVDADAMAVEAGWSWQGPLLAGLAMIY